MSLHPILTHLILFPAHAGMNRLRFSYYYYYYSVPRTRGDEPRPLIPVPEEAICSPHTRG